MELKSWHNKKICVLGDIGLDAYQYGTFDRFAPEAPVPIFKESKKPIDYRLGLAANVAANVKSLGGDPYLVALTGDDRNYQIMEDLLAQSHINSRFVISGLKNQTTFKKRLVVNDHIVMRIDAEETSSVIPSQAGVLLSAFKEAASMCEVIVIQDYHKGVDYYPFLSSQHWGGKIMVVDPNKNTPVKNYQFANYLTPNLEEAQALCGTKGEMPHDLAFGIKQKIPFINGIAITLGKDGMYVVDFSKSKEAYIESRTVPVFDVCGAGDTVSATVALALSSGMDFQSACEVANVAASCAVKKFGTSAVYIKELEGAIRDL